jgi:hypothetical protein
MEQTKRSKDYNTDDTKRKKLEGKRHLILLITSDLFYINRNNCQYKPVSYNRNLFSFLIFF